MKNFTKAKSLRFIVTFPFLIQLGLAVTLIGYLSFKNAQQTTNDISRQLLSEIAYRVKEKLTNYTSTANLINQLNAEAIQLNELKIDNSEALLQHFWKRLQRSSHISFVYWGDKSGEFYGARRLIDGREGIAITNDSTDYKDTFYEYIGDGKRGKNILTSDEIYNPRLRPWYKQALKKKNKLGAIYM